MNKERYKILYEVHEEKFDNSAEVEAYRNRWGHWVWAKIGSVQDPSMFGVKARTTDVEPRLIDGKWFWVRVYDAGKREDTTGTDNRD